MIRTFFDEVFAALGEAEVRFVVVGGVAVVLHGYARFTNDLDLVVDLDPVPARRAVDALVRLGLRPTVPVDPTDFADPVRREEWRSEKGMQVFSLRDWDNPLRVVDLFVQYPVDFEILYGRAEVVGLDIGMVRVAALSDLIAMKRAADRPQDRLDIEHLEAIRSLRENGR